MNLEMVEKIADVVLYEGYILYPYRASTVKNQQRWNFGVLCPQSYCVAQKDTEAWMMQTQCLAHVSPATTLDVKVRFLHLMNREVGEFSNLQRDYVVVPSLELNGRLFQSWQEAVDRDVVLSDLRISTESERRRFSYPSSKSSESLPDSSTGQIAGVIVRTQEAIEGEIEVSAKPVHNDYLLITIRISNQTDFENASNKSRDEALLRSFVSTHTILHLNEGEFVSLLDPPLELHDAAAGCNNVGTYPVLIGDDGERDCMLSSPIILYDYPKIAPESAGDLCDGTEIDEILTLRILTLTEDEKREMRGVDERARRILERTESLSAEQLLKLHGAVRHPPRESKG